MSRGVMTTRPVVIDRGGGACEESQAPFLCSFRKEPKGNLFISLMQEKRNQRVHYPQGPLQRGMQTENCRNRQFSVGFGKPGHGLYFFNGEAVLNNLCHALTPRGMGASIPFRLRMVSSPLRFV